MDPSTTTRPTLLVVDGHSLAFRAFYALPVDNFSTEDGQATNAVYGFLTMLSQVIETEKPDRVGIAFDVKGGTFRNELLAQYKGTREAAPEELLSQLPLIQQALTALGVRWIEKTGYEGDDVIATLATMGERDGCRVLVLSGDRDAFQLIDDDVTVLYPGYHFKDLKHMDPAAVEAKYHVTPRQYPDLAALRGETSDNIPGVPGVGDGFAAKWINQYGSLDAIIEHADEIGGKKGEALRENLDQVRLNRRVNTLVRDLDLGVTIDDLGYGHADADLTERLFGELQFGERTRTKLLASFNTATDASGRQEESSIPAIVEPLVDTLTDAASLSMWIEQYCPPADATGDGPDRSLDVIAEYDRQGMQCADAVRRSWTLYVDGDAKPGHAAARMAAIMAGAHAVVFDPADPRYHDTLRALLDTRAGSMSVHGFKESLHMLTAAGLRCPSVLFDTNLAGYLIDPDFQGGSLEECAAHFLDIHIDGHAEGPSQGTLGFEDDDQDEDPAQRCIDHAAVVAALARRLAPEIERREQYPLLRDIELPTSRVLFHMERIGASVDRARLDELHAQFADESARMEAIAERAAGRSLNLQSPKQLGVVLFEEMGLTPTKKTRKGSYTTNAAALQMLYATSEEGSKANEFLGALLRHRETNKLKQIVETLIDAIDPKDGRIHTTFTQTVTATGRLSSVDPNLQNIPNRNAAGREIRSGFVPGDGFVDLLSADYSQVELRIMADLSGDEALIEAFRSGADFHRYVASLVFGVPVDEVTPDERGRVKAMSYGLAYGLSTYGLSKQLGISNGEATTLRDRYFETFGKVHDYLESLVANARRTGYTETIFGRRRYFPDLNSPNRQRRDAAERGALNAPIQGSAADIMKIAMIRADRALRDAKLVSRVVLQIHDELVVELAAGEVEEATALVKDAMEHAVDLAVPLDVSTGVGVDWQRAAH
ncbi:DNA polymerase I [Bifidobacterium italicum]|uniref:DNA polymerase I n=1 Tax=Bifidobacterium italicum TaxID=1960968 RepID=A0A2A2EIF2_9BIFI|nr:DNA polymerase I [Bifidobacterium italicum]PAU68742.1 DNA polymerase I [Bifidobacterium italicum]